MRNEEFFCFLASLIITQYFVIVAMFKKREVSILHQKSKHFSSRIIKMVKYLSSERVLSPLHQQILKSGTSIHANIRESEFAQSVSDFVSKLSIALKEANETSGWLDLFEDSGVITSKENDSMKNDCEEIIAILIASIKTIKANNNL